MYDPESLLDQGEGQYFNNHVITTVLLSEADVWKLIKFVIPKVTAEWEDLAFCMTYKLHEVNVFKKGSHGDVQESCKNFLKNWLSTSHGPVPKTYKTLLSHIKQVETLSGVSDKIEEELITGTSSYIAS